MYASRKPVCVLYKLCLISSTASLFTISLFKDICKKLKALIQNKTKEGEIPEENTYKRFLERGKSVLPEIVQQCFREPFIVCVSESKFHSININIEYTSVHYDYVMGFYILCEMSRFLFTGCQKSLCKGEAAGNLKTCAKKRRSHNRSLQSHKCSGNRRFK